MDDVDGSLKEFLKNLNVLKAVTGVDNLCCAEGRVFLT